MDRNNEELKGKLQNKINEKRVKRGVAPINNKITNDEALVFAAKEMIKDCNLPQMRKLKPVQRSRMMLKKYQALKDKNYPLFLSIVHYDVTMANIGMLEMMIKKKNSIQNKEISMEKADEQMKELLYEKYKIDDKKEKKSDK